MSKKSKVIWCIILLLLVAAALVWYSITVETSSRNEPNEFVQELSGKHISEIERILGKPDGDISSQKDRSYYIWKRQGYRILVIVKDSVAVKASISFDKTYK